MLSRRGTHKSIQAAHAPHRQLTLAHVQATGFAKSTVLLTEQLAINLGDVVALGESIFAVLYRPYNFNTERKPYRVLRMDLSLEDPRA